MVYFVAAQTNLSLQDDNGVVIKNLSSYYVISSKEVMKLLKEGNAIKATSSTSNLSTGKFLQRIFLYLEMNEVSSRSHTILTLAINQKNSLSKQSKSGKLYLVDLAGIFFLCKFICRFGKGIKKWIIRSGTGGSKNNQ